MRRKHGRLNAPGFLTGYGGAVYAELEEVRSEVTALAALLEHLPAALEREAPAGLSRLAWHIVKDIEGIQREIEKGNEL
jgi:hypothetical protein